MVNWIKRCFRYVFSFVGVFLYIGATGGGKASKFGQWLYEDMNRWIFGASVVFMLGYTVRLVVIWVSFLEKT